MRATTLFLFFLGILLLAAAAKYKTNNRNEIKKESSISPWGEPYPSHKEEMLQEQEEEEDRYDIEEPEEKERIKEIELERAKGKHEI